MEEEHASWNHFDEEEDEDQDDDDDSPDEEGTRDAAKEGKQETSRESPAGKGGAQPGVIKGKKSPPSQKQGKQAKKGRRQ